VIARRAHGLNALSARTVSSALIMATTMMYLRLLAIIFVFNRHVAAELLVPFSFAVALSIMVIIALLTIKNNAVEAKNISEVKNPLELSTAILFALFFMLFAFLTQYVTSNFGSHGLKSLAIIVGFTDIDPFILSLLSGKFIVSNSDLVSAIILASGSNNLLKGAYAVALARNKSVGLAAAWLVFLFIASIAYVYI